MDAGCRIGTAKADAARPDTFSFKEMSLYHEFTMGVRISAIQSRQRLRYSWAVGLCPN